MILHRLWLRALATSPHEMLAQSAMIFLFREQIRGTHASTETSTNLLPFVFTTSEASALAEYFKNIFESGAVRRGMARSYHGLGNRFYRAREHAEDYRHWRLCHRRGKDCTSLHRDDGATLRLDGPITS